MQRRDFLKLMGIVSGSAVVTSCNGQDPHKQLISRIIPQEGNVPGIPSEYQTTCTECDAGCGIQVRVREGNHFKLEGVPGHPVNDGGLCIRGQASLARLLHPERLNAPLKRTRSGEFVPIPWAEAFTQIGEALKTSSDAGHKNLYLSRRTTGTLSRLIDEFCSELAIIRTPSWELFNHAVMRRAYSRLLDIDRMPQLDFSSADFLFSMGADLLETYGSPIRNTRQITTALENGMQWVHAEPHFSLTGNRATKRLCIRPGSEPYLLSFLIRTLGSATNPLPADIIGAIPAVGLDEASRQTGLEPDQITLVRDELNRAQRPLIMSGGIATGSENGACTALLTCLLQWTAGMIGDTIDFSRFDSTGNVGSFTEVEQILSQNSGSGLGVCFVSRIHSDFNRPGFLNTLGQADFLVGLTDFLYPPMEKCQLLLPLAHAMESWGDVEPSRGLTSIIKPVFSSPEETLSEGDILLRLMKRPEMYRTYLAQQWGETGRQILEQGFLEFPADAPSISLNTNQVIQALSEVELKTIHGPVLCLQPSVRTYDGRSRPITLLHEIPDPISTITYGNWATVSSSNSFSLSDGSGVLLKAAAGDIETGVKTHPLLTPETIMIHFDQLPESFELPLNEAGEARWIIPLTDVSKSESSHKLPVLSGSFTGAAGRGILPHDEPHHGPHGADHDHPAPGTLYPPLEYTYYRWAMAIDLDKCTGCSACVAACYIENNIAIVGPAEHNVGREMSWLRLEPHLDPDGSMVYIPMMCQHCENAPCEAVCPVYATYHGSEGLNQQVYNRCVGTRYCANNCPYKVRRFNWFDHEWPAPLNLMLNPEVSVRPKGVMEKCTFCIQRIRHSKDLAKDEGRLVTDGEMIPACAQSCPAGAITLGNILDRQSRVYSLSRSPRAYRVLEGVGTEPAIFYLSAKRVKA